MSRAAIAIAALGAGLAACGSCSKGDSAADASPVTSASGLTVVPEVLPRCRGASERVAITGEDVVVGDVAIGEAGLAAGVIRVDGGKRVASVLRTSLELASPRMIDIGVPLGDDPPPSPRFAGANAYVAFFARRSTDAGARLRELDIARLEEGALGKVEASILQQADESTAFDVAWNDAGAGLVAWDEDAPVGGDAGAATTATGAPTFEGRGFVKVQAIGSSARRVASPESSDAESPRLLARPNGGFWLAWLARRAEDEPYAVEGPGEKRAFRWVEVVALGPTGDAAGPVRRVSPEKGRALSFELGRSGDDLVVMVQDEAAPSEGAGARIVRYLLNGEKIESVDVVDGGVGTALAELVPAASADAGVANAMRGAPWLSWTDPAERAHLAPLGPGLTATGRGTAEPSLDGARVLAAVPPDGVYALVFPSPNQAADRRPTKGPGPELRRFVCTSSAGGVDGVRR